MITTALAELSAIDALLYGAKSASLGELIRAGFNVPPGFAIPSGYSQLAHDDFELGAWSQRHPAYFEDFSRAINGSLEKLAADDVYVRSSANCEDGPTASFAGVFDSFVASTPNEVVARIAECWASRHSPRVHAYCQRHGIRTTDIRMGVIIQKLINSEVSGVCFTVDPSGNCANRVYIEAAHGLGEGLVSGRVTPDSYSVDRNTLDIRHLVRGEQATLFQFANGRVSEVVMAADRSSGAALSDQQVREIATSAIEIEKRFGGPQDVEFAICDHEVFYLQARPVTTSG